MTFKNSLLALGFISGVLFALGVRAEATHSLKPFTSGSYQQLIAQYQGKPFVLVLWSITCPACLKEMPLLSTLHKSWPALNMVMLATDDVAETAQVEQILTKYRLNVLENWVFAGDNTQKLNYEIDPNWYGELPRTYFFDAAHQRHGFSGVLTKVEYENQITTILKSSAKAP